MDATWMITTLVLIDTDMNRVILLTACQFWCAVVPE